LIAEQAEPIFKKNNWTWLRNVNPPKTEEIVETIRHLCIIVKNEKNESCATGRFKVSRYRRGIKITLERKILWNSEKRIPQSPDINIFEVI